MRSIDLTSIPKKGQFYDWMKSVGCTCHVIWDNIELDFMIIDVYRKNRTTYLKIISNHRSAKEIYNVDAKVFLNKCFSKIIRNNVYDSGDMVNDKLFIEDVFIDNSNEKRVSYKIRCIKCGHRTKRRADDFENGAKQCPCCDCNHIVKKGINDIATKRPDLVKYFYDKEDAYRYSVSSNARVKLICPDCNTIKEMSIDELSRKGLRCTVCGDGTSYPNKFMRILLDKCNVCFIPEYSPEWANGKKYDFYLIKENVLIEMDGGQHYKNVECWGGLSNTQENDEYKTKLALEHGVKLIRINCNYTNIKNRFSEIKNEVNRSELSNIIKIKENEINWDEIDKISLESYVVRACEMVEKNKDLTAKDIAATFNVNPATIKNWLKVGNRIGLCEYDERGNRKRGAKECAKKNSKPLICVDNGELYKNLSECANSNGVKMTSNISMACNGHIKTCKGFHFKYLKDLTLEEFTYYNCEQWLKDNELWEIFVSKNKVV